MAIEVIEKFESRRISTGAHPSADFRYTVRGTNDEVEARAALADESPTTYDPYGTGLVFLPRDRISVDPAGDELWDGQVHYGTITTNETAFTFDTGGGTQHITQSLQTVGAYPPSTAPDFKGAIGVTPDSIEGVDIVVPVYHFSETHVLPSSTVTPAYKGILVSLTGRVNNASFKGLAAGECLFLGAAGGKRGSGDWEIAFNFAASPNVTNLTIGDITGISKLGWEYLWVRYIDDVDNDAKALIKKPVAVYVEQVYKVGDLSQLGIGTT